MKILYKDLLSDGTVTGALPVSGYFLSNIIDTRLSKATRWPSASMGYAEFDLGATASFDTVTILSHNLTSAATINVKTGSTSGFAVAVETFPVSWTARNIYQNVTMTTPARYIRVEFTDAANPDGYVNIGRVMAEDEYEQPGFSPSVSRNKINKGEARRSMTDQLYGQLRYTLDQISLTIPEITSAQLEDYEGFLDDTGVSVPYVIYIEEADKCSINFGLKVEYVSTEEAAASLEMNEAQFYSTRRTMRVVY